MTSSARLFPGCLPKRWIPAEMLHAPALGEERAGPVEPLSALLINPFYPKDANASFGKHVLTPTLALTSIAATTPAHWRVEYWDENLLHGSPPCRPMPQAVGITVHLTFAKRAYELADWYRARGSKVILGGLHVLSCPENAKPMLMRSLSAMASRSGRASCGTSKAHAFNRATSQPMKTTIATILRRGDRCFHAAVFSPPPA